MAYSLLQQPTPSSRTASPARRGGSVVPDSASTSPPFGARDLLQQTLLRRYAPVSLLVDSKLELHGSEGPVGGYRLRAAVAADAARSILGCQGFRDPLREAVRRAEIDQREIVAEAALPCEDGDRVIGLQVAPLGGARRDQGLFLVTLLDPAVLDLDAAAEVRSAGSGRALAVHDLAAELAAAIKHNACLGRQLAAAEEKTRKLDEELFQLEDEYQAACEGLKAAHAQLEAENRAPRAANQAFEYKVQDLECQANDLDNLLNSTNVATLFLGPDLCIRWYTPAMQALIPLEPWDLGRHAGQLAPRFSGRDLAMDAAGVLRTLETSVTEVQGADGRWHIRRILPYRTRDDHIDGVWRATKKVGR